MKNFIKCGLFAGVVAAFAWIDKNWFNYAAAPLVLLAIAIFAVYTATRIEGFLKKIGLMVFLLALIAPASAQTGDRGQGTGDRPQFDFSISAQSKNPRSTVALWTWEDGALVASFVADEVSTRYALETCPGCHESGLVKRPAARIGIKAAIFTGFKLWEWQRPDDRSKIRWLKRGAIGLFAGIAINNFVRAK